VSIIFYKRLERSLGFFTVISVISVIQATLRIGLTAMKFLPGGKIRRNREPHHYISTSTLKNDTLRPDYCRKSSHQKISFRRALLLSLPVTAARTIHTTFKMKRPHDSDELPIAKRAKPPPEVIRGDQPVHQFFLIWKDAKGNTREVPARCLLDWGSTTFAISKRFVTAFNMPTIERDTAIESYDASGRRFEDDGKTRTYPLRFSFGNHCSDEVFEVMTMGDGMEIIVPYWWMQKHRASGVYDGTLRLNDCPSTCFHSLSPGWSITYNRDLVNLPQNEVFTAGAITPAALPRTDAATASGSDVAPIAISAITTGSILLRELLPEQYHKYLLLFAPEQSEKLPEHRPYDHAINLTPRTEPKWGPVYRLSREEFEALKEYIAKMIKEGKIRPLSSPAGSPVLFVSKPGGRRLRLCVDYRDLNKITIKDCTPLPIMDQLAEQVARADWFTKLDL
jgi:hypothetical protein